MNTYTYTPKYVCSREIRFGLEDGKIHDLSFVGGCDGNLKGISSLLCGMRTEDAIARLDGIRCGRKATSCPDQLAQALKTLGQSEA